MTLRCIAVSILAAAPLSLFAQSDYPHHNFTFGVGTGQPRGDLRDVFRNRPAITAGYGYRFQRYFQADLGFETVFGAAGVHDYLETGFGALRIRDVQYFLPVGGRAILPLAAERVLISGGGGGAYIRYSERLRQPGEDFHIDCVVCGSRDGWAYYALADVSAYVDRGRHIRVGVVSKVYRGHTDGEPLGAIPGMRTRDHWINTYAQVGFSF